MFDFIKESNLALEELAKKDKKYKSIVAPLKTLLSNIKREFLSFEKAHQLVLKDTNDNQEKLNHLFSEKIKTFKTNIQLVHEQVDQELLVLDEQSNLDLINLKNQMAHEIDKINNSLSEIYDVFLQSKSSAQNIRSKEISIIERNIINIKKQSALSIEKLESNHHEDITNINEIYANNLLLIDNELSDYEKSISTQIKSINETKNFYRDQSDKKYLSIKSDYHQALTEFNKSIDNLKIKKADLLKDIKDVYESQKKPLEAALDKLKSDYQLNNKELEKTYKDKVETHKNNINIIIDNFNIEKEKLIKETGESISLLNSKLSSFRDAITSERQDKTLEHKKLVNDATTEDEIKTLNKEHRKFLRNQENELNKQIIRTEKETQSKMKEHYHKLSILEYKLIEDKSNWRMLGKKIIIEQKQLIYNNEQNYIYEQKVIEQQLKHIKQLYELEMDRLDHDHLSQIAPLDLKLSIANSISEKDVNLLSNDTNYHLSHYQYEEDSLNHKLNVFRTNKKHEISLLDLKLEHETNVLNMTLQLQIDKENVLKEQQLANQKLKKDLINHTFESVVEANELKYLQDKTAFEIELEHFKKQEQAYSEYLSNSLHLKHNTLKVKLSLEDSNLYFYEQLELVNNKKELITKDLEVIHSRVHFLFNQIYLIYNIHHHFMLSLINFYEIPAHPEDVKQFIQLYLQVFKELKTLQEYSKDQFLFDLNTFQEQKINDLTSDKLNTDINILVSDYQEKIRVIDDKISNLKHLNQQLDDQVIILSSNIDRIQSLINNVEKKDLSQKELSAEKLLLSKQLNNLESEIATLDATIIKNGIQIEKLYNQLENINKDLNHKKSQLTIKNQKEAKNYLQQKVFYTVSIKKVSQLFESYEDRIMALTSKLDQPIYLTDKIMNEYQKGFINIEELFEKQNNSLYQDLLRGSVKLSNSLMQKQNLLKISFTQKQKSVQSQLQSEKTALETSEKKLLSEFNIHLENLIKEKDSLILNIKNSLFKEKELELEQKRKAIKIIEDQIMSSESNLTNEMMLIDANLKSVIEQMNLEYNKQVLKLDQNNQKAVLRLNELLLVKEKNLKVLQENTSTKNTQLSSRFTHTENKLIEQNKQKLANLEQSIIKKQQLFDKKRSQVVEYLKEILNKKNQVIKENDKKMQKFTLKVENHEKVLYLKELEDAKKSYIFKQKTLKL
ncbi:hypothetical protein [Acholeplasma granularum]|uniref:hypothetical protein n=1 Tax=Acholeplasma granularum TaxID=264635 RepID=UPI00046ED0EA|nr:hypothetical protein [Acholeplasma granularum]